MPENDHAAENDDRDNDYADGKPLPTLLKVAFVLCNSVLRGQFGDNPSFAFWLNMRRQPHGEVAYKRKTMMNIMKTILTACAVVVAGFCSAENQVASETASNACPCKCACNAKRCERPKPVSLTLSKDVKSADVETFKKALLTKVDEMVAKARASEQTEENPPVRLMLVVDGGRRGHHPGPRGCVKRPGDGPQGRRSPEGCPPPPPPAE